MNLFKAQNLICGLAFLAGASLAVVACGKKDDDKETTQASTAAAALVLQINASCDGSPCL